MRRTVVSKAPSSSICRPSAVVLSAVPRCSWNSLGFVLGDVRKATDDNAADGAVCGKIPAGSKVGKGKKSNLVVND